MRKPISPDLHGVIDYSSVLLTAAAPKLFGLSDRAAKTCAALAGGYLALSALTDYDLSVRRLVPFPVHGAIEGVEAMALPFLPRLLGFGRDRNARIFLCALAAMGLLTAVLTDWKGNTRRLKQGETLTQALKPERNGAPAKRTRKASRAPKLAEAMA
ncbi:MAG TPA: hypothetical protein VFX98_14075 [Longimicrobiaceae bacterium]|nr:hypothetical protein [Longimicrobiaceae bacterium]